MYPVSRLPRLYPTAKTKKRAMYNSLSKYPEIMDFLYHNNIQTETTGTIDCSTFCIPFLTKYKIEGQNVVHWIRYLFGIPKGTPPPGWHNVPGTPWYYLDMSQYYTGCGSEKYVEMMTHQYTCASRNAEKLIQGESQYIEPKTLLIFGYYTNIHVRGIGRAPRYVS